MSSRLSVVVPTLGRGDVGLGEVLRALRRSASIEIVLVCQGAAARTVPDAVVDRVVELPAPVGFAAAANRGIEVATGDRLLLLNDDARLAPEALDRLARALDDDPEVAAVQPTIFQPDGRIDSLGVGWNRSWQAVQRGRGDRSASADRPAEVFGVHGAVALFRRRALTEASIDGRAFDEDLDTYYEDVELAGRLRARGWSLRWVPGAEAVHSGGGSAAALGVRRSTLLYRNRLLVLARFFGSELWSQLPRILWRDVRDGLRAPHRFPAVLAGWREARARRAAFAARGGYRMPPASLRRFREA